MIGAWLSDRRLNVLLRLVLGVVFVSAAWYKVAHPDQFAIAVRSYRILPVAVTNLFAIVVAWGELVAGGMLLAGLWPRRAAGAAFLLLAMFEVALTTVLVRGLVIDCGCFGPEGHGSLVSPWMLARNALLMVAAAAVMVYNDGWLALRADAPRRASTS